MLKFSKRDFVFPREQTTTFCEGKIGREAFVL
jgi:hypothetical protein